MEALVIFKKKRGGEIQSDMISRWNDGNRAYPPITISKLSACNFSCIFSEYTLIYPGLRWIKFNGFNISFYISAPKFAPPQNT